MFDAVATRWVQKGGRVEAPTAATRAQLERAHAAAYVDALERTSGRAVMLDPDTFTSPDSEAIARLAAGAAVQAAAHAIGTGETAFALVRPPGHHAEPDRAMGFCFYNNAAVAACSALDRGLSRVAIVDIDVHHGNGTQRMFFDDPRVLYLSTHQYPYYPGTGAAEDVGVGAGRGYTFNVPMEAGSTDADYALVYGTLVEPILDRFDPQLTIVSAGFDAHERDPLASMRLTTAGYAAIVARLRGAAARHGSLALVTEGGYELTALAACLEASFAALEEGATPERDTAASRADPAPSPRAARAIALVREAQKPYWRGL